MSSIVLAILSGVAGVGAAVCAMAGDPATSAVNASVLAAIAHRDNVRSFMLLSPA
jgi:hypothetical protein